jgi:hypothetical protein
MPVVGDLHDEWWCIRKKLHHEQISLLPPALEIRLDVEKTLARIWELSSEHQVMREVEALNERIARANRPVAWGPPSTTMPIDLRQVLNRWRQRHNVDHPPAAQPPASGGAGS